MGSPNDRPSSPDVRSRAERSALLGALLWALSLAAGWLFGVGPPWPEWLAVAVLLFSPLVLVPLVLSLVPSDGPGRRGWTAALRWQLPAALCLVGAFGLPAGGRAAGLALPWLAYTGLLAGLGVVRLVRRRAWDAAQGCIDAGLVYLAVGGGWVVISRFGLRPLELDPLIVLLTAAHFHFAGLVLPVLTGLAGRALPGRTARAAAVGVVAGVPLVALGITLERFGVRLVEWLASWLLAAACVLVAWLHLRLAGPARPGLTRFLFAVSGLSLPVGMGLAALYGVRAYRDVAWLTIPVMLVLHATVNAFGFCLPGLLAWGVAARVPTGDRAGAAPSRRTTALPRGRTWAWFAAR